MSHFVDGRVTVTVPATAANLGPGFDCLGLALDLRDTVVAEVTADGLAVEVEGEGVGHLPRTEDHLVVRAMRVAFDELGGQPPGLRLRCTNAVPIARGLGSSAAAIVGGLGLARALVADGAERLDDRRLLALAADLEGHPDNVAPALSGGFTIAGRDDDGGWWAVPSPVDDRVRAMVLVPPEPVATETARGLLPGQVPHADAATTVGRAALLVAALAGRPEQLWRATHDRLHQEYRRPAMADTLDVVDMLRADGVPAVVSGAGPSVLALTGDFLVAGSGAVAARCPAGWRALDLDVDRRGLVVG